MQNKDFSKAYEYFSKGKSYFSHENDSSEFYDAEIHRANCLFEIGNIDQALKIYKQTVNKNPTKYYPFLIDFASKNLPKEEYINYLKNYVSSTQTFRASEQYFQQTNDLKFLETESEKNNYGALALIGKVKNDLSLTKTAFNNSEDPEIAYLHACLLGTTDPDKALKYYKHAAKFGHKDANLTLAIKYFHGWGVPKDDKRGNRYLKVAKTTPIGKLFIIEGKDGPIALQNEKQDLAPIAVLKKI